MKHAKGVLVLAFLLVFLFFLSSRAEYKHQFTGTSKCRVCHMSKEKGDQYGVWKNSKHAQAYQTLATEEAQKAAAKAGKTDKPPQENPACLKCHVAGWDAPPEMLGPKYDKTEGVTCESCHGPGKDYSTLKVMKDKELATQNGLILKKQETCPACHNKESPTYKPFSWDTYWPKVAHKNPQTP